MIPVSLYIHLPWCIKKCPYCDFNSHSISDKFLKLIESRYVDALMIDFKQSKYNGNINSIFIGGGTPSLFSGSTILDLMCRLRKIANIDNNAEITMEINPNSASFDKLKQYYQAGINRLSIGAQSFDDDKLHQLGRAHNSKQIITCVQLAQKVGFSNINLDLMFGLPNQTTAQALNDLQQAINLEPNHISWYQLTIEPNTEFYHQPPKRLPKHNDLFTMQVAGIKLLNKYGFKRYEISAFTKNKICKHNLNYWLFGDYLGIGAGAHGKVTNKDGIYRTIKYRNPEDYMQNINKTSSIKKVAYKSITFEFMLNALRLKQGFDFDCYEKYTGLKIVDIMPIINIAIQKGLLEYKKTSIGVKPSNTGFNFLNNLLELFLID